MKQNKSLFFKYLIVVLAQLIIGIGVGFLVTSGMGNDPMGVMISGLSLKTGVAFGTTTTIVNIVLFLFIVAVYRKRVSLTTLITAVVVGLPIDSSVAVLKGLSLPDFAIKFIFPFLGCFIIGTGVALYLSMDMGASIADNIILMIGDFTKKPYSFGCYFMYTFFIVTGLLLGGVFGYATLVSFLLTGKIVDFALPKFTKTIGKWVNAQ